MPSYKTLAILALAASTASPALSAPVQENSERALNRRELATRFGLSDLKSKLKNMDIKTKLKNFGLMMAVTWGATTVGSGLFHAVNKPSGEAVASTGGEAGGATAEAGAEAATPHFSEAATTVPTYGEPLTAYPATGRRDSIYSASTDPTARSVAEWEERALGHMLPVNRFARSVSDSYNLNRRTPSQLDLLSRDDLGEALRLISRMLLVDELD